MHAISYIIQNTIRTARIINPDLQSAGKLNLSGRDKIRWKNIIFSLFPTFDAQYLISNP
jgi:hypothetical protein